MYIEVQIAEIQKKIERMQDKIEEMQRRNTDEILTPKEFAEKVKLSENTVYCWVREGRIKALPNLGTAIRIPMSQFYDAMGDNPEPKKLKSNDLKTEFLKKVEQRKSLEAKKA